MCAGIPVVLLLKAAGSGTVIGRTRQASRRLHRSFTTLFLKQLLSVCWLMQHKDHRLPAEKLLAEH